MAERFESGYINGLNSAIYVIYMDVSTSGAATDANVTVTVSVYYHAESNVQGGYNFTNNNKLTVVLTPLSGDVQSYSNNSVGKVTCSNTGDTTLIKTCTFSVPRSAGSATITATFEQTANYDNAGNDISRLYDGTVTGSVTFGEAAPVGHLDHAFPTHVRGWAGAAGSTAQYTVNIKVYASDGTTLIDSFSGIANQSRPDLVDANRVPDEYHGFVIPYDFAVKHGAGTYVVKGWAVYNSGNSTYQFPETHTLVIANRVCVFTGNGWQSGRADGYDTDSTGENTWFPGVSVRVRKSTSAWS